MSLASFVWTGWQRVGETTFDDAFMFVRYAKHYLAGAGFSWNPGDGPAYGATSFLYLLAITLVLWLTQASDSMVLTATSFTAGVLSCIVMGGLGFLFAENAGLRRYWIPLLIVPCVVLWSSLDYHARRERADRGRRLSLCLRLFSRCLRL